MGEQYYTDIISALAERTIKRLWIIIILLILLLTGSNLAWFCYERSFTDETVTQEVWQSADEGSNRFVGGDYYYGIPEDQDNN